MKTLEFIYMETEIHFLVNPSEKNVMINATEMAKLFGKRTKDFLANQSTKDFINEVIRTLNGVQIIEDRGRNGIYFERRLALKFASWLSPEFEVWVFSTIDEIVFGNYKKHWEAHAHQEQQKLLMENLKKEMLVNPTPEIVAQYFECEREHNSAKYEKSKAIRNQLKLFGAE